MNRLNQTAPAHFQFCRVELSLGILFFSIFRPRVKREGFCDYVIDREN
jgi:hypothetical protein